MLLSEILGVERDTDFSVEGYCGKFRVRVNTGHEFFVVSNGKGAYNTVVNGATAYGIIAAAPAGIIHLPPPLTDEQREQLKALYTLGYFLLAMDKNGEVFAYSKSIFKQGVVWVTGVSRHTVFIAAENPITNLVSWSDPEPFDIGKALGVGE